MQTAEVFCLGNEILIGRTVNTNANYLAQILTGLGLEVRRITTVRDDLDLAAQALQELIDRNPRLIVISGGLGPTFDDIQLQVVARAIGKDLEENAKALELITAKYDQLNPARRKMAQLPEGAMPLRNSVGSAPGVITHAGTTHIISLPGVPAEMKAIMEEEVLPWIEDHLELDQFWEFGTDVRGVYESTISHLIDEVRKDYPEVSFKSHPSRDDDGTYLSLHTYSNQASADKVREALEAWINRLKQDYTIEMTPISPFFDQQE